MTDNSSVALSHPGDHWINNPAWTLLEQAHDGRMLLVLTGGADETYIVDEAVSDACVRRVFQAWQNESLSSLQDDPECGAAVRQIQRVGALVPPRALPEVNHFSVAWLGDPCESLMPALATMIAENRIALQGDAPRDAVAGANIEDLLLVVRTNAQWDSALSTYAALRPRQRHLFVDTAYHHTVSIGPYVVPGETACVACLGHRIAHRWGDLPGPAQPAMSSRSHSIAAVLAPLLTAAGGLLPFLEHSVSLNLQTLASVRDKVFQLPGCPVCEGRHDSPAGALNLPWQVLPPVILSGPAGR
ncbi:hypothetical protein [Bordetella genomosp. 4]|uniref:TOMM leader peptide-binding protein n=1 Tax=Bordetella genomosp. 4 TaxID=463044 RepID=A0A261UB92_9BORD|nr:hypothetical protein [Bordetella genomosp. 4]OZI59198.1 hypothetical protein CAL20_06145 [Bordetella genomosp. 4]